MSETVVVVGVSTAFTRDVSMGLSALARRPVIMAPGLARMVERLLGEGPSAVVVEDGARHDAVTLVESLRRAEADEESTSSIPVVVVCERPTPERVWRLRDAGVGAVVAQPFTAKAMRQALSRAEAKARSAGIVDAAVAGAALSGAGSVE